MAGRVPAQWPELETGRQGSGIIRHLPPGTTGIGLGATRCGWCNGHANATWLKWTFATPFTSTRNT
jgi:hypothetical protein